MDHMLSVKTVKYMSLENLYEYGNCIGISINCTTYNNSMPELEVDIPNAMTNNIFSIPPAIKTDNVSFICS